MPYSIFNDISQKPKDLIGLYVFQNFYEKKQNLAEFPDFNDRANRLRINDQTFHQGGYSVSEKIKDNFITKEYISNSHHFKKTITHIKHNSVQKFEAINLLIEGEFSGFSEDFTWFRELLFNNTKYQRSWRDGSEEFIAKTNPFKIVNIHISSPNVYNVELESNTLQNSNRNSFLSTFSKSFSTSSVTLKTGKPTIQDNGIAQIKFILAHNPFTKIRFISMLVDFAIFPPKDKIFEIFREVYKQNSLPVHISGLGDFIKITYVDPNLIEIIKKFPPVYKGHQGYLDSLPKSKPNDIGGINRTKPHYTRENLIDSKNWVNNFRSKCLTEIKSLDHNFINMTIGVGIKKIIYSIGDIEICSIGLVK